MEIKINRKVLLNALANTKPIITGRHTLAILSSILINTKGDNEIEITATDLETGFKGVYPAEVISQGSIAIPHKELNNFITKAKAEEIRITETEKGWINISGDSTTLNIACMLAEDFPMLPEEINCEKPIEIDAYDLKSMIAKAIVVKAQGGQEGQHIKNALFKIIKNGEQNFLQMASTDGGVLVQEIKKIEGSGGIKKEGDLIPKKALNKLSKSLLRSAKKPIKNNKRKNKDFYLGDSNNDIISFGITDKFFVVQIQNETIIISLSEGSFPDYAFIIDTEERGNKFIITADRMILLAAMKQMETMASSNYKAVTINIENNILKMVLTNPDAGEMKKEIIIEYNGPDIEVGFQPNYFVDFLNLMNTDIINLDIIGYDTPCIITGDQDEGLIFVIMPYRMN